MHKQGRKNKPHRQRACQSRPTRGSAARRPKHSPGVTVGAELSGQDKARRHVRCNALLGSVLTPQHDNWSGQRAQALVLAPERRGETWHFGATPNEETAPRARTSGTAAQRMSFRGVGPYRS